MRLDGRAGMTDEQVNPRSFLLQTFIAQLLKTVNFAEIS